MQCNIKNSMNVDVYNCVHLFLSQESDVQWLSSVYVVHKCCSFSFLYRLDSWLIFLFEWFDSTSNFWGPL